MAALTGVTAQGARWSCPVSAVSRPALRLLSGRTGLSVHSVFSAAVNLRVGDRLVTCTSGGDRAPHGVAVNASGLSQLQRSVSAERAVLGWVAEAEPTQRAVVYDPSVPRVDAAAARTGAHRLLEHLERARPSTGFGDDWARLARDPALSAMVHSASRGVIGEAVLACLGRGPGLTPSGDDVLVGAVCALRSIAEVDAKRLARLDELLEGHGHDLTTDVSVEYLRYACRGMASGAVVELLTALGGPEVTVMIHAVDRLRRFGHTSGMDMLLGVIIALTADAT